MPRSYPSHSFVNPLSLPFAFVGNFGETRPNHFHSGLDMRTGGKENQAVHAVDEGYISRVKISAGGFGNAIYITHASGYTTVYAHLNKFFPKLEQFVRKQQYQRKQWDIDLNFFPDQFWVRKGSFIAWSGNTGSSQGPHLHFEVRNAKSEAPLNPLLFYSEIQDTQPPVIKQLAWYDGYKSIYQQWPHLLPLVKGKLKQDTIIVPLSKVFFAIAADDFMPMGYGTLGVYEMRMYADDVPVIAWQLDDISYDLTRYVNALADYHAKKAKGISLQLCRKLPNNKLPVFKSFSA
ncbi:MAG: M23 family metallopeptidase, partial [Chitinophagaceae bacterium]|nr:M23 family metallopeptidase [Chitinophagaceae bacterium]